MRIIQGLHRLYQVNTRYVLLQCAYLLKLRAYEVDPAQD
jgi:hypothetical protein